MKHFLFIVALMGAIINLNAQEKSEAKTKTEWTVSQTVEIPAGTTINEGTTKNGNPKYWIEIPEIGKVTVSAGSAEKFKEGTIKLELVKWTNSVGKIKYSTRQLGGRSKKTTPDVNLTDLKF